MIRIVVESNLADRIRRADGQVELVDDRGNRIGIVRRPPTEDEIAFAKSRMRSKGPKATTDELISKLEAL